MQYKEKHKKAYLDYYRGERKKKTDPREIQKFGTWLTKERLKQMGGSSQHKKGIDTLRPGLAKDIHKTYKRKKK